MAFLLYFPLHFLYDKIPSFIIVIYLILTYLTYNPLKYELFKDSINNMYGIKKELVLNYFKSLTTLFKNPFFAILFSTK